MNVQPLPASQELPEPPAHPYPLSSLDQCLLMQHCCISLFLSQSVLKSYTTCCFIAVSRQSSLPKKSNTGTSNPLAEMPLTCLFPQTWSIGIKKAYSVPKTLLPVVLFFSFYFSMQPKISIRRKISNET